MTFMQTEGARL